MNKIKEKKYIDYLEKSGFMIFKNIKELKEIVLETINYDELLQELIKRHSSGDCDCGN